VADVLTRSPGTDPAQDRPVAAEARDVVRHFGATRALDGVSLQVRQGEIHALLGPNGAGKTTLLRSFTGLVEPSEGTISLRGIPSEELGYRGYRQLFGYVPSGDRSFYLRISGLENLAFFGRLYGLRKERAFARAWECLEAVGLEEAARIRAGLYSHGMQKRLSVARGLLSDPVVLFVDEATHDLDPEGARRVQDLIGEAASRGTAVVWATQRLDEIRGFADQVTVLDRGTVRFLGTVPELMAIAEVRRYVLQLDGETSVGPDVVTAANDALMPMATVSLVEDSQGGKNCLLDLQDGVVLGDAISALTTAGIRVLACREDRSGIETAFLNLTKKAGGRTDR
jgi:ABC-type multidrug transport system ATPase subunit